MSERSLSAGAAEREITPEPGIQLAGTIGFRRPVESVRDPLFARALVLEQSGLRVCLVSLDLLAVRTDWSDIIRKRVGAAIDASASRVILHATQNHSAPSIGHCFCRDGYMRVPNDMEWLLGGDDRYNEPAIERIVEAAEAARERLEPVSFGVGSTFDGRIGFNRRLVLRDGTARMGRPGPGDALPLQIEGPTDPEVGVAAFRSLQTGDLLALLLHHTAHPTLFGARGRIVSADWPGIWADEMKKRLNSTCVPLVINGCCGNIQAAGLIDPNYPPGDEQRIRTSLGESSQGVLDAMEFQPQVKLGLDGTNLRLRRRPLEPELVSKSQRMVANHPLPVLIDGNTEAVDREWIYAVCRLDFIEREPESDYELQVLHIGDLAVATVMGEPFVEAQLRIKLKSMAPYTFVAHFCNGFIGYIPTARAIEGGGYETWTGTSSQFEADSLDRVADGAIALINESRPDSLKPEI